MCVCMVLMNWVCDMLASCYIHLMNHSSSVPICSEKYITWLTKWSRVMWPPFHPLCLAFSCSHSPLVSRLAFVECITEWQIHQWISPLLSVLLHYHLSPLPRLQSLPAHPLHAVNLAFHSLSYSLQHYWDSTSATPWLAVTSEGTWGF